MVEWSVAYARKTDGSWKKGIQKATLQLKEELIKCTLEVHIKSRCLEQLQFQQGAAGVLISRIDQQIRFLYTENSKQFAVDFGSIQEALQCKSILVKYAANIRDDSQQTFTGYSQESQQSVYGVSYPAAIPMQIDGAHWERKQQELALEIKHLLADVTFKDFVKLVEEIVENDPEIARSGWWHQ